MIKKNIGLCEKRNIESNCHCFHTCQHLSVNDPIFNDEYLAKARETILYENAEYCGVMILHHVIMPNHTHDLVWCDSIEDLGKFYRSVNISVSKRIRARFPDRFKDIPVFSSHPRYTPVITLKQYYYTVKYMYNNPNEKMLERTGFDAKFTSFHNISRGYFPKGYDDAIYERMFGLSNRDLFKILELPLSRYFKCLYRILASRTKEDEMRLFKIRPNEPFSNPNTQEDMDL